MTDEPQTWTEIVRPLVERFEVAAAFDQSACWNAEGSRAMASILKRMAKIIDEEIERRDT